MVRMKSDLRRVVDIIVMYASWLTGSFAFLCVCFGMVSHEEIYIRWAIMAAVATGALLAYQLVNWIYDTLDGDR